MYNSRGMHSFKPINEGIGMFHSLYAVAVKIWNYDMLLDVECVVYLALGQYMFHLVYKDGSPTLFVHYVH